MSLGEKITLAGVLVNFVGLAFVARQAVLARRALDATEQGLADGRKKTELEMLPSAATLFHAQACIDGWLKRLAEIDDKLTEALSQNDVQVLACVSGLGERNKGLVPRPLYESKHRWLSHVLVAGAQHYYQAANASVMSSLWDESTSEPSWPAAGEHQLEVQERINYLRQLRSLLDGMVPEAIAEAPASIADSQFVQN